VLFQVYMAQYMASLQLFAPTEWYASDRNISKDSGNFSKCSHYSQTRHMTCIVVMVQTFKCLWAVSSNECGAWSFCFHISHRESWLPSLIKNFF
jgi:hypothetical protein